MEQWRLVESTQGLRMEPSELRAMGEEGFTWAHLLYGKLGSVAVGIFYFPSRFDTAVDNLIIEELRTFGRNTGESISVNIWDPRDSHLQQALELFGLKTVSAVVLASGLKIAGIEPRGPDKTPLYSIIFDDPALLSDPKNFSNLWPTVRPTYDKEQSQRDRGLHPDAKDERHPGCDREGCGGTARRDSSLEAEVRYSRWCFGASGLKRR